MGSQPIRKLLWKLLGKVLDKWRRRQNYLRKTVIGRKVAFTMESQPIRKLLRKLLGILLRKVLGKLLRKMLGKVLGKLLGKVLGKLLGILLRKLLRKLLGMLLGKWRRGQNYLRKTVISGKVAFRMG